jgi:hypothetical protein
LAKSNAIDTDISADEIDILTSDRDNFSIRTLEHIE